MKKIIKIILGLSLIFGLITVYSYNLISNNFGFQYRQLVGNGSINYDNYDLNNADTINEDIEIHTGDNDVLINQVSRYDNKYINDGLRIKIAGIGGDGNLKKNFFSVNRFGRFEIKDGDSIRGYKRIDEPNLSNYCPGDSVYYSLSGSISSYGDVDGFDGTNGKGDYWGEMTLLKDESYFCPRTKKFKLAFNSKHLGKMEVSTGVLIFEYYVTDPYGNTIVINSLDAFDNKKVYISGILRSNNIDKNSLDYNGEVGNSPGEESLVIFGNSNLPLLYENIKRNLHSMIKGLKTINLNSSDVLYDPYPGTQKLDNLNDPRNIFYYNYEGLDDTNGTSNIDNKGVILKLGDDGNGKIPIDGKKTLIVKGGNIYIDTNIYNKDKDSLLTIIVTRDEDNNKNGGNIYINPDVTNIDAILIADGSILSFVDSPSYRVLNSLDDGSLLEKQLLIYGAVVSKNTIGKDTAPYGSDRYIKDGKMSDNNYNLANLRSFEVEMTTGGMGGDCNFENKIRVMGGKKNMFAGKKECYIDDAPEIDLRGSGVISPLLIYSNPMIQLLNPKILEIK